MKGLDSDDLSFLIVKAARLNKKQIFTMCLFRAMHPVLHIKYLSKIIKHNCFPFPRSTSFIQQINMPRIILYGGYWKWMLCALAKPIFHHILVLTEWRGKHWKVLSREMTWIWLRNVLADESDTYICLNWWRGYLSILGKRWYGMWNKLGQEPKWWDRLHQLELSDYMQEKNTPTKK